MTKLMSLDEKLKRTAAKSGRRKTAIKQLQRSLTIQTAMTQQHLDWNRTLNEQNWELRKEKVKKYAEIEKTFYRQAWFWRLWGGPKGDS